VKREWRVWVLASCWVVLVLCGFWRWERYDRTAGAAGLGTTQADKAAGRWRLTVFAHPHCPCSRATLRELDALARANPALATRVLFVRPSDSPSGWERGDAWDAATGILGVEVACDDGAAAGACGAKTSGHAVLTDPTGRAVFRGGLTRARGRAGTSEGRNAVEAWVGGGTGAAVARVFGCPLFAADE
jgi:hypothetical protein